MLQRAAALTYLDYDPSTRVLRLDPHEPAFVQDPYQAYAWMHENARAFFWHEFGIWCFAGYDEVNGLLRDRRVGRQPPVPFDPTTRTHLRHFDLLDANSMLELEPPVHTKLRTLVNRAFVSRQVERLRPRINALVHELVDRIEEGDGADLLPALATPVPITVIAEMLGVPVDMGPQLLDWSHRMVAMYMHGRSRDVEEDADRAARDFSDFIRGYARERRSKPGDDLLSLLITAHESGEKLTEDELVSSTILLLNAGHEATVHQTGNAIRAVLMQDGDRETLFATPEATAATVEECLRFDAPLHMFRRYAYGPTELPEGVMLGAGEEVGLMLGAANRDSRAYVDPHSFDPSRPDQKNVSFGAGIHFCIGAPLARIEMQETLAVLFRRLPKLALAEETAYRDTYHFHGLERLLVTW